LKKITLLSDTHGFVDEMVLKFCRDSDEIWHAGDWGPDVNRELKSLGLVVRGVYGNIDSLEIRLEYPEILNFEIESFKVCIKHIGGYPEHYAPGVKEMLRQSRPHLFISGHSHILKIMPDRQLPGLLHINPGAAGVHGFHAVRTLVTFKITAGKIHDLNVVELAKRA
jgi:hypothetical protein